jgi:hypothetical protein
MGSRKRDGLTHEELQARALHLQSLIMNKMLDDLGPMPRYMARLDAAEAVCEHIDALVPPFKDDTMDKLLAAWRKAKAASEEEQ